MNTHLEQTMSDNTQVPAFSLSGAVFAAMPAGTIRIGHTIKLPGNVEMPVAAEEFRVTLPFREEGDWVAAPIDAQLRKGAANALLREIPVRVQFNDPSLSMRSRLEAYDPFTKRLVCTSNGNGLAKRRTDTGLVDVACDGCNKCAFSNRFGDTLCKPLGRLSVQIEGQEDELAHYVLRTSSYHSQRNLEAKLWQYKSLFGGLRGLPLALTLREMQTEVSNWESFFVLDFKLRASLAESKKAVVEQADNDQASGVDLTAYESVVRQGLSNGGVFGETDPEGGLALSEFGFVDAARFQMDAPVATVAMTDEGIQGAAASVVSEVLARVQKTTGQAVTTPTEGVVTHQLSASVVGQDGDALLAAVSGLAVLHTAAPEAEFSAVAPVTSKRPKVVPLGTMGEQHEPASVSIPRVVTPVGAAGVTPDFDALFSLPIPTSR